MSGANVHLMPGWRPMSIALSTIGPDLVISLVDDVDLSKLFARECGPIADYSGPDLAVWVQDDWCLGVRLADEAFRTALYSSSVVSDEVAYVSFPSRSAGAFRETVALGVDRTPFSYPELLLDVQNPGLPSGLEILWPSESWGPPPL